LVSLIVNDDSITVLAEPEFVAELDVRPGLATDDDFDGVVVKADDDMLQAGRTSKR
jgi:hypothetical protein